MGCVYTRWSILVYRGCPWNSSTVHEYYTVYTSEWAVHDNSCSTVCMHWVYTFPCICMYHFLYDTMRKVLYTLVHITFILLCYSCSILHSLYFCFQQHCLAGWNSTKPPSLPPQPTLDLKSNLTTTAHPSLAHPHTSHPSPPTHPSPSGGKKRAGRSGRCAVSRSLLDSSHRAEYSLRSRGHTN